MLQVSKELFCNKNKPMAVLAVSICLSACPIRSAVQKAQHAGSKLGHVSHTDSLSCHIHMHTQQLCGRYYSSATSLISWLNRNVKSRKTGWCDDLLGTQIMGAEHILITARLSVLLYRSEDCSDQKRLFPKKVKWKYTKAKPALSFIH